MERHSHTWNMNAQGDGWTFWECTECGAQRESSGKPLVESRSTTLIPSKAQIGRIRFWAYKHSKELYPWQEKLLREEELRRAQSP